MDQQLFYEHIRTGNIYKIFTDNVKMKVNDQWVDGVAYVRADGSIHDVFVRSIDDFNKSFQAVMGLDEK